MTQWTEFDRATGDILSWGWGAQVIPPEETKTRGVLMGVMANAATEHVNPVTRAIEPKA